MLDTPDFGLVAAPPANWVAVACAAHVRQDRAGGFMQMAYRKAAPLRRLRPGDRVVYYSPTERSDDRAPLQAFTAIGIAPGGEPYTHDIGNGFCPSRRDVAWAESRDVPIKPLLQTLDFTARDRNWSHKLRFGLFAIGARDFDVIAIAMGAGPVLLKSSRSVVALLGSRPVDLLVQNHQL